MSRPLSSLLFALLFSLFAQNGLAAITHEIIREDLPGLPVKLDHAFEAKAGNTIVVAGGILENGDASPVVYILEPGAEEWKVAGELEEGRSRGGIAVNGGSVIMVGGIIGGETTAKVTSLSFPNGELSVLDLPPLPEAVAAPAATVAVGDLYVAGGTTDGTNEGATKSFHELDLSYLADGWVSLESWTGPARHSSYLFNSIERLYLMGGIDNTGRPAESDSYHRVYGWSSGLSQPPQGSITSLAKVGDAHAMVTAKDADGLQSAYLYHTIGDTWVAVSDDLTHLPANARVVGNGATIAILSDSEVASLEFGDPKTNYGWWDHLAVAGYFGIMIYIGFHFTKQKKSTKDYFRGGNTIPWWATGMSLFATAASAVSLLAMPGKSYSSNWTFFTISIYSLLALPISMFLLAPLVRKLNFATAFEYLEHRFGLAVRMFGSAIFVIQQILGRMGPVMLLPSIAMAGITGIDIKTCIIAMGIVTTLYTFLGGLSAVIWTDTIQGIIMVGAVLGCLILVYFRIDMPSAEIWSTLADQEKMHMFDWGWTIFEDNVAMIFIGVVAITLFGISDQNYVQRVQCTPTLADAKKAIATQIAVAVPVNILLFALGTALFLFYRQQPAELNPVMANDGIFPFFAAQQLPPGISGLVVAALLAATMSTISSGICSVSNLGVDDFYKRFNRNATDEKAVVIGRLLTVVVGGLGIGAAIFLSEFETPSIWDLALMVISFITSTTIGIFALGLFTRRANEMGVLAGIVAGLVSTWWIQSYTDITFWIYPVTGSLVTYGVGYAVSLITGGNKKDIEGLTLYTLKNRRGGLDD